MAQQVFPTKSNLMATKRSLALATQGYDLMDRKRNILVREMMQLIDRAAGIQDRISAAYAEAYEALKKANIMLGSVGGYAAGVPVERGVQMSTRSVMGVELPTLRLNTTSPMGLYYDLESTNGTLDVAYLKFNEVKTLTVELAEVETSVIRLAEAIQKTQKRANALGNVQIPQMQKTIKSIDEVLSEREREEFSRLKVIKAQKEKEARRNLATATTCRGGFHIRPCNVSAAAKLRGRTMFAPTCMLWNFPKHPATFLNGAVKKITV